MKINRLYKKIKLRRKNNTKSLQAQKGFYTLAVRLIHINLPKSPLRKANQENPQSYEDFY